MRELSLFSGAGGGLLATKHLLGWETLGYVEFNPYCQQVLQARIADGLLDAAPIFGDVQRFLAEGYAERYRGLVDVVSGGFPCQPFSVAGRQLGADDPRNMWPATLGVLRAVRPRFAFLENVPGLLANEYFGTILGNLAEAGFNAEWCVLGADDVSGCHRRQRLWILAYSNSIECKHTQKRQDKIRLSKCVDAQKLFPWGCEPPILGGNNVVANRVDRLKAIGNGQVPQVAATAWEILSQ